MAMQQDESLGAVKIDLRRYVDVLKRRAFAIFFTTMLFLLIGVALAAFWPATYESSTKVVLKELKIIDDSDLFKSTSQLPIPQKTEVLKSFITSKNYILAVLEQLSWVEFYESSTSPAARTKFLNRVAANVQPTIKPDVTGSELVQISFTWTDPVKARDFVEKLRDYWIDSILESYKRTHKEQLVRMESIFAQQQLESKNAQKQLDDFQSTNKLPLDLSQNSKTALLNQLTTEISKLESTISGQDQQLKQMREALAKVPKMVQSKKQTPNPDYAIAQGKVLAAQKTIELYQTKGYTDKHPYMQRASTELQQALADIGGLDKFLDSEFTEEPNKEYNDLHFQYIGLNASYEGSLKSLAQQKDSLATLQKEIESYPFLQNELSRLKNAVDVATQISNNTYVQITPMRNRVSTFQQSSVGATDPLSEGVFQVLEDPVASPEPSKPMALIFTAAALVFGLALGVVLVLAQETLKQSLSTADDVRRLITLPVLATIGQITTEIEVRRARVQRLFSMAMSLLVLFTFAASIYVCTYHSEVLPQNLVAWVNDLKKSLG